MNNNNRKISHEAPSRRRHYRLSTPLWVTIDNQEYLVRDWSLGGVAVKDYKQVLESGSDH